MTRTRTGLFAGVVAVFLSGTALAQPYPMQSDPTRPSTGNSAFPNQGPLPIQRQGNPFITPGMPLEAAPGVPNGLAAETANRKSGRVVSPMPLAKPADKKTR